MEQVIATEKYCTNLHGASLWDLTSTEAQRIFSAWRMGIKITWDLPRSTHSYLVQEVLSSGLQSLELRLLKNFAGFFRNLLNSSNAEAAALARLAARDVRS